MKALERRQALIELLCERRHDKIGNLAFEFGVNEKTIRRDIQELSLSYPIYTECSRGKAGVYIEESYYFQLLKMLGVAYVAEFASNICRDAGQQSVAGMIELFAKISIVVLSIPGLVFLMETLEKFV